MRKDARTNRMRWRRIRPEVAALLVLLIGLVGISGCQVLLPPPSPPPPDHWPVDPEDVDRLADAAVPCYLRMQALSASPPCDWGQDMLGSFVVCKLAPPLRTLRFGCGTAPREAPTLRLAVAAEDAGELVRRTRRLFGDYVMQALDQERADRVEVACPELARVAAFFDLAPGLASAFRTFPGRERAFPNGLFLGYPDAASSCAQKQALMDWGPSDARLPFDPQLYLETDLLDPEERRIAEAQLARFLLILH